MIKFFLFFLSALALCACSGDNPAPEDGATLTQEGVVHATAVMNVAPNQAYHVVPGYSFVLAENTWDQNNLPRLPEVFTFNWAICTGPVQGYYGNSFDHHVTRCTTDLAWESALLAGLQNADALGLQVTLTANYDNTFKADPKPFLPPVITWAYTVPQH